MSFLCGISLSMSNIILRPASPASPERADFLNRILSHEGKPYIWGYKGLKWQCDANGEPIGFDCSGLVTDGLYHATKGRLDWRANYNCNKLWEACKPLEDGDKPDAGDLVLYGHGKNMLTHVMVYMADGRVYGASGGNSDFTTLERARLSPFARVKFRDSPTYRADFKGFRKLPL